MSLDTVMNLSITVEDRAPAQAGFGRPLLFGYHTRWVNQLSRLYQQASDMLDDGFTTTDALYKAAVILKSQNPSPADFKIGRRVVPLTQVIVLTPQITTQGYIYSGTIGGKVFTYTVLASATLTTIGAAMASAITALAVGFTAASVTGVITLTGTPGVVVDIAWDPTTPPKSLNMIDATTDTTTDTELAALVVEDGDWYGLNVIDSSSKATGLHVAGWMEAQRRQCVLQTADTEVLDSTITADIASDLKDSAYARTGVIFHRHLGGAEWLAVGWLGGALTASPGSATMAFKTVTGVKTDRLQPGEQNTILLKNASYYIDNGLPQTFEGKSGAGEFMDIVRFIDWVHARMQEDVVAALSNNLKIPFTDTGVAIMVSLIKSVLQQGIDAGGFAADPAPIVTAPAVKDVPAASRIARILPDVNWRANLAGAIHRMDPVKGRVAV